MLVHIIIQVLSEHTKLVSDKSPRINSVWLHKDLKVSDLQAHAKLAQSGEYWTEAPEFHFHWR